MSDEISMLDRVRQSATHRLLFLPHAVRQMARPERMITRHDVRQVIATGQIIEDYPEDIRGHSCLMLGYDEIGRPVHIVCSPKIDFLAIITAYVPNPQEWESDFKRRR